MLKNYLVSIQKTAILNGSDNIFNDQMFPPLEKPNPNYLSDPSLFESPLYADYHFPINRRPESGTI